MRWDGEEEEEEENQRKKNTMNTKHQTPALAAPVNIKTVDVLQQERDDIQLVVQDSDKQQAAA